MIDRICISINNRCNLRCEYCHFREKGGVPDGEMDVHRILDQVIAYARHPFRIGFVGNGEPFLDFTLLKEYLEHISGNPWIRAYTITNGTISLSDEDIRFLERNQVNVGFSLDGYRDLHNRWRCGTFDAVMANAERYRAVTGHWPTFNATVGEETLRNAERVIRFFEPFGVRITFSRMIGRYGISLEEYRGFLDRAGQRLQVRRGALDCTMYGGLCGAGINNFFFANGKAYLCGNCADLPPVAESGVSLFQLAQLPLSFDRTHCYKEEVAACVSDCTACPAQERQP